MVNGQQQRIHGRGHGRMGHDEGHCRGHGERTQVDMCGSLADQAQHRVGHAMGEAGYRKCLADDDRPNDEPDGRVQIVGKRSPRVANQKKRLDDRDGNAGDADRHDLEHPPGRRQPEQAECELALGREFKRLAHRVHGRREVRHEECGSKNDQAEIDGEHPLEVDRLAQRDLLRRFGGQPDLACRVDQPACVFGISHRRVRNYLGELREPPT